MAPKDSVDRSGSDSSGSSLDWDWIAGLDPDRLDEDDLSRIVASVTDWRPAAEEDPEKVLRMFHLSAAALRSRDVDLVIISTFWKKFKVAFTLRQITRCKMVLKSKICWIQTAKSSA